MPKALSILPQALDPRFLWMKILGIAPWGYCSNHGWCRLV